MQSGGSTCGLLEGMKRRKMNVDGRMQSGGSLQITRSNEKMEEECGW
jgi:hypothetical protein